MLFVVILEQLHIYICYFIFMFFLCYIKGILKNEVTLFEPVYTHNTNTHVKEVNKTRYKPKIVCRLTRCINKDILCRF